MTNLNIISQRGTMESTKNVDFELSNIPENVRIKIENGTDMVLSSILDEEEYIYPSSSQYRGKMDLNVPEYSSQSIISIFANIEQKQSDDSYKLIEICPSIFYIEDNMDVIFDGDMEISPSFLNYNETCSIKIKSKINDRFIFSINDKRLGVLSNSDGNGSFHFRPGDILNIKELPVVQRFPVYFYSKDDSFIKRNFTGLYLNILPSNIMTYATDPRCSQSKYLTNGIFDPTKWSIPDECLIVEPPGVPDIPDVLNPNYTICNSVEVDIDSDACRLHRMDDVLLTNGMILHAYANIDKSITDTSSNYYNKGRISFIRHRSSFEEEVIIGRDVALAPKESDEDFEIAVERDIHDKVKDILVTKAVRVLVFDEGTTYDGVVKQALGPDEYGAYYKLLFDRGASEIEIKDWKFCRYAVFYEANNSSSLYIDNIQNLPYIEDTDSTILSIINVVLGCNKEYIDPLNGESYVYVIAEATVNNQSQLFFYSFAVGPDEASSPSAVFLGSEVSPYGWYRLTYKGNNRNPKVVADRNDNLCVVWESDRSGTSQLYYGVIGPSSVSYNNSVLSSILDKQAEFLSKTIKPFSYLENNILIPVDFAMEDFLDWHNNPYPEQRGILQNIWRQSSANNGNVVMKDSDAVEIFVSNATQDTALAFTPIDSENGFEIKNGFSQINYQISFTLSCNINQSKTDLDISRYSTPLTSLKIDDIYDAWKSKFKVMIEETFDNHPVYFDKGEKFIIGRDDNIYDKFVPIVGSYNNPSLHSPSWPEDFQVIVSGSNRNLKHFMIGLMFEKTRFKATNVGLNENPSEGASVGQNETQEIYTGRAKLVVVYNTANSFFDRDISYAMVRKVSDTFDLNEKTDFNIIVNYSKMFDEDVANSLNVSKESISSDVRRHSCNVSVLMGGTIKFSESFLVDASENYDSFDIGFGVPTGGQFLADRFFAYNSSVYDNLGFTIDFTNVRISSPSYQLNSDVVIPSSFMGDRLDLVVEDYTLSDPSLSKNSFLDQYGKISLGIDYPDVDSLVESNFMQLPLTIEGFNKGSNISLGNFNDIHIVWQSNRSKYWDVYYLNGADKKMPFRFDTQITNTRSNSLMPSVSINREGKRLITWHDDREGSYAVYCARSLDIEKDGDDVCRNNGLINYSALSATQFTQVLFNFQDICDTGKRFHFVLKFYGDPSFRINLIKSISSKDSVIGWKYNGVDFPEEGVISTQLLQISYIPTLSDNVDGKVLYIKVVPLMQDV